MAGDVKFKGWDKIQFRLAGPVHGPKTYFEHRVDEALNKAALGPLYREGMTDAEALEAFITKSIASP